MNPALILPLMMRTTRAGMSGISIPPAVSGGLQENQGTRTDLTSVRNLTEADTKKELAKIAAKAKENQRLSEGAGNKGMQISANLSGQGIDPNMFTPGGWRDPVKEEHCQLPVRQIPRKASRGRIRIFHEPGGQLLISEIRNL